MSGIGGDLDPVGGTPGWFEAWTFVLDNGKSYVGAVDNGNVSDIVHLYADGAEMWSMGFDALLGGNFVFGGNFAAILANALTLTAAQTVQVVGDPLFLGARRFTTVAGGEIGLVNEGADGIAHMLDLQGPGFSGDTLDIISTADGRVIPEPATLTLMGIGGAIAAIRRRRRTV